jgi:hypothetical protein
MTPRDIQSRVWNRATRVLLGMYHGLFVYLVVGVCISICQYVLTIMPGMRFKQWPKEKE